MFDNVCNRDGECGNLDITQYQQVNLIDFHNNVFLIESTNGSRHFIKGRCLDSLTLYIWHCLPYMSDSDVVSRVGSSGGVSQEFNQGVAKEARAQTAAGAGSEAGAVLTPAVGCCSLAPGYCRLCQTCCTLCCPALYSSLITMFINEAKWSLPQSGQDGRWTRMMPLTLAGCSTRLFMKLCLVC